MSSFDEDPTTASRDCAPSSPITNENPLLRASNPLVSDLEQEVLDEYTRLLGNVNKVRHTHAYIYASACTNPASQLATCYESERVMLTMMRR